MVGTQVLLDEARKPAASSASCTSSTDEVYGSPGGRRVSSPRRRRWRPNSPYSASKTASDLLVRAAFHTHGFPGIITRCSNNYGPYQFPEKLIPLMIANAREDKPLPVYGDGMNVRDWLYVQDHCEAILAVLERGHAGEVYNIGGNNEYPNIEIVRRILAASSASRVPDRVRDRPARARPAVRDRRVQDRPDELGWSPRFTFETGPAPDRGLVSVAR